MASQMNTTSPSLKKEEQIEGSGEGNSGSERVIFFKFGSETKKAQGEIKSFSSLLHLFKSKFQDSDKLQKCNSPTQVSFYMKDPQYDVTHQVEDIADIYDGAILEGRLPQDEMTDEDTQHELLDRLQKKINLLEEKEKSEETPTKKRRIRYEHQPDAHVLRIRGLPWGTVEQDVHEFFCDEKIVSDGVYIVVNWQGRATGEAYVQFETEEDMQKGLSKNKKNMRTRYIEVFPSHGTEMFRARCPPDPAPLSLRENTVIVKMRGLPYDATEDAIRNFFGDIQPEAIHMTKDSRGRASGEAFVEFVSDADREKAIGLHKQMIGKRYIELFQVTRSECEMPKFHL